MIEIKDLFTTIANRDNINKKVLENTRNAFSLLLEEANSCIEFMKGHNEKEKSEIYFDVEEKGDLEFLITFASDILQFVMHTNVFEFPRDHMVMRSSYVKEDVTRSYCGCIHIYNFLTDSVKHKRVADSGYLIGRIFINKEGHYFLEGKHELGLIYNNFNTIVFDKEACQKLLYAAMQYSSNFDLLIPPYEEVKEIKVIEMLNSFSMTTAKRLGFKFQADTQE